MKTFQNGNKVVLFQHVSIGLYRSTQHNIPIGTIGTYLCDTLTPAGRLAHVNFGGKEYDIPFCDLRRAQKSDF